jgi:hypothetical protein
MEELEQVKELLGEAEGLCVEFLIALQLETYRTGWEVERLSKQMAEEDATWRARYSNHWAA